MAIIDITVIPIGTETTSVSEYVIDIHQLLKKYGSKIKYELTSMNTIIEGDLDTLLKVAKEIHELPFQKGIGRVATSIRIDDRRDKEFSMESKVAVVRENVK